MGGQEVKQTTPQDVVDYLNELCPMMMSLGMSLEEYWHGEPDYVNFYIKADELRNRKINNQLWLQGAYIYHALCCSSPMFNSLAKDHKPRPYLDQPFALSEQEKEDRAYEKFKSQMIGLTKLKTEGG